MNGQIITVTLNPAIDQTISVASLQHGAVNIADSVTQNAGGKGVNVAGCLADWGIPVLATGILGQDNAAAFETMFKSKGIGNRFVMQSGSSRVNIKLVSRDDGATTDINLPGQAVSPQAFAQLMAQLDDLSEPGHTVVLAGSLPRGIDPGCYATLVDQLRHIGLRVVLDTSGPALVAALEGPSLPFCIKPNRLELEQWAGKPLPALEDVIAAARTLHQRGVNQVVVSLAEQGALFVGDFGALLASPPPVIPVSSVGAGDSLLAGWLAGQHQDRSIEDCMRLALAFADGKLERIGPNLPEKSEVERLALAVTLSRVQNG